MKKLITLAFVTLFVFTACEGPEGPPGEPGINIVGETFEYTNVNFTEANGYTFLADFDPPLINGDAMLVYRLQAVDGGADVWEQLPSALYYTDAGTDLQYWFNYTLNDVKIGVESNDYPGFGADFLSNQVFRAVIVPADLMNTVDTENIDAVMKAANIKTVQRVQ